MPSAQAFDTNASTTKSGFKPNDFTLPRPLVWIVDESRPYRIQPHVFPFFRVALTVTNQMIEKPLLPMRRRRPNRPRQSALQDPHPLPQREVQVSTNKKMNVIWHNHITPEANSAQLTLLSEMNQRVVYARVCKKFPALVRIERNKIQRRIIPLKDTMQPRRSIRHGTRGVIVGALVPSAQAFLDESGV